MNNYFTLFGLQPSLDIDEQALERSFKQLMQQHHPDAQTGKDPIARMAAAQMAAAINTAYETLSDELARARYLLQLHDVNVEKTQPSQAILLEAMEMREGNVSGLEKALQETREALQRAVTEQQFEAAAQHVLRLTYLKKVG